MLSECTCEQVKVPQRLFLFRHVFVCAYSPYMPSLYVSSPCSPCLISSFPFYTFPLYTCSLCICSVGAVPANNSRSHDALFEHVLTYVNIYVNVYVNVPLTCLSSCMYLPLLHLLFYVYSHYTPSPYIHVPCVYLRTIHNSRPSDAFLRRPHWLT
jgi:hypothetical protein